MKALSVSVAITLFALTAPLAAQDGPPPGGGPPREALAACSGRSEGASCSFQGRGGESVSGTCGAPPDRPLACMPAGGPPGGHHRH
jgi:hypothetical protein